MLLVDHFRDNTALLYRCAIVWMVAATLSNEFRWTRRRNSWRRKSLAKWNWSQDSVMTTSFGVSFLSWYFPYTCIS